MKHIFSIIMEYGLGLPTGTIAFWGTFVPRILTVDYTFNMHSYGEPIDVHGNTKKVRYVEYIRRKDGQK